MKRKLLTLSLILLSSWLFAATAQATSCGGIEFALVAQGNIGMGEPSTIGQPLPLDNGNVLSVSGTVTVGTFTTINGKLYAPNIIILANGAPGRVLECHGTVTGDTAGCGAIFPFDPPAACIAAFPPSPLVTPVVDACVNLGSSVNKTFNAVNNGTATNDLAEGCYKDIRLNAGAIVLVTGPGVTTIRSLRLVGGSELKSSVPGTRRTVNDNTTITTNPNTTMTDLLINVAGTQGSLVLANNTHLNNTTINSPFRNIHTRTGTELNACSEVIGSDLTIEPITTECGVQQDFCTCEEGFQPEFQTRCIPIGD